MTSTAAHRRFPGGRVRCCTPLALVLLLPMGACSWRAPRPTAQTSKPVQGGVTFSDVVLAQTDVKGTVLWRFQAKGVTSGDRQQQVTANQIKGQLYEGGKPLFDVAAERGTVRQDQQQMRLQGKIQVLDRRRRVMLRGREVQWNPQKGLLTLRDRLTVTHPQLQLQASQLEASRQGRLVKVTGNVVMQTRGRPRPIQLKANEALWNVEEQSLRAGTTAVGEQQPTVQVQYGQEKSQTTALAGEVQANLKTGLVTLRRPVQLAMGTLTLTSRELQWDTVAQRISTQELLQIQDPRRQVTLLASRGSLDQLQNLMTLEGNVEVTGLRDRARLTSDRLVWNTTTERIEALGNVQYAQASPAFNLRGGKAVGKLEAQTLQISGGEVVTEIVP